MEKETLKNLQTMAINYLGLVGLWKEKDLKVENPISRYFIDHLTLSTAIPTLLGNMLEEPMYIDVDISFDLMLSMIKEAYDVFLESDNILSQQNEELRGMLIQMIGNSKELDEYLQSILVGYKESLFNLLNDYDNNSEEYNEIKCGVLTIKMNDYALQEDYDNAISLRNKINGIKKGE